MARTKTTSPVDTRKPHKKLSLGKKTLRDLAMHRAQGVKGGKANPNPSGG